MLRALKKILAPEQLSEAARAAARADRNNALPADPGADAAIPACAEWLARAQDCTASNDDGAARDFSLQRGWATSYPETTGYIVPTLIEVAQHLNQPEYGRRAQRMLDWLVSIQFEDGGFQGGKIDATPCVPVTFNTGQILLGLAAGVSAFGEAYGPAMHGAARFLRDSLDEDGCWRSHPTPFAKPGEKAYETHVSWGLFEAARVAPNEGYGEAGLRQVRWALTKQHANGWVDDCCLVLPSEPLTHTLGYFLKGVVEAHRLSGEADLLAAAQRTADGLISAVSVEGRLPGRLRQDWSGAVDWVCLTGSAQIADSLFYLYGQTGREAYRQAGSRLIGFVRRTIDLSGDDKNTYGGVKGSYPVDGDYGRFEYLNWAPKFTIDACLSELALATSQLERKSA